MDTKILIGLFLFLSAIPISSAQKASLSLVLNPNITSYVNNTIYNDTNIYNYSGTGWAGGWYLFNYTGGTFLDVERLNDTIDQRPKDCGLITGNVSNLCTLTAGAGGGLDGILTANKWCVANSTGTGINCTEDAPAGTGTETDPEWTGNYTLCSASQKLYFDSPGILGCSGDIDTDTWATNATSYYTIVQSNATYVNFTGYNKTSWDAAYSYATNGTFLTSETDPIWYSDQINYYTIAQNNATYMNFSSLLDCSKIYGNATDICSIAPGAGSGFTGILTANKLCYANASGTGINCTADNPPTTNLTYNAGFFYATNETIETAYNISMSGYVNSKVVEVAAAYNTSAGSYTDSKSQEIATATNATMKDYVDARDTAINTSSTTYSVAKAGEVDTATNTSLKAYIDSRDTVVNTSSTGYSIAKATEIDIATNTTMQGYCYGIDVNTNSSVVAWADSKFYLASNPSGYTTTADKISTLTAGKWCRANESATGVNCTADTPAGGSDAIASCDDVNACTIDAESMEGTDWGTLTNTKWCIYDSAGSEVDCNVDPVTDTDDGANASATGYCDARLSEVDAATNTTMKAYVDSRDTSVNTSATAYSDARSLAYNNSMATYVNAKATEVAAAYNTSAGTFTIAKAGELATAANSSAGGFTIAKASEAVTLANSSAGAYTNLKASEAVTLGNASAGTFTISEAAKQAGLANTSAYTNAVNKATEIGIADNTSLYNYGTAKYLTNSSTISPANINTGNPVLFSGNFNYTGTQIYVTKICFNAGCTVFANATGQWWVGATTTGIYHNGTNMIIQG